MENSQSSTDQNLTETAVQQQASSNNKLFVIIIVSVLLTAMVVGSAVYFWQKSASEKAISNLEQKISSLEKQISVTEKVRVTPQPSFSPELPPTPTTDPTANWNVYVNQLHGFSIRYPENVYISKTDGTNRPLVFLDTKPIKVPSAYGGQLTPFEIRTTPLIKQKIAQEVALSKSLFYPETYLEKQIIEPEKGMMVSGTGRGYGLEGSHYTRVFLDGKNGLVVIDFQEKDSFNQKLFEQILSTFEFTD